MSRTTLLRVAAAGTALLGLLTAALAGLVGPAGVRDTGARTGSQLGLASATARHWVASWAASPSGAVSAAGLANHSVRSVVHLSLGGTRLRVHLSNVFGPAPVYLERTTVGLASSPANPAIRPGTLRDVTFGGSRRVVIPAGGSVRSDPVRLVTPAGGHLAVSLFTPFGSGPATVHRFADQVTFLATGPAAADPTGRRYRRAATSWYYLTGVDVFGATRRGAVVAFGDSITDGIGATANTDHRWPDRLAARVASADLAVLDAGISGNRLRTDSDVAGPSALHRLDRDALDLAGVRTLIVLEGINDIQLAPRQPAGAVVAAIGRIVARAHARGVRVVCGTLTPYAGSRNWTPRGEAARRAVNARLRGGGVCDGVADTDAALRDPSQPRRLAREFDSGDHLHPNDAGYAALAAAVAPVLLS